MKQIDKIAVEDLILDPDNPRLPEEQQGGTQEELIQYLNEHDVLDELIDSFIANGYFDNEPLLVVRSHDGSKWTVVEGNRRAAALMRLLGTQAAEEAGLEVDLATRDVPPGRLESLHRVPAFELANRNEVSRFLGFRHISGLKTWGAEAKARYLWIHVEEAAYSGSTRPFYDVGRQVGSNTAGVRTAYNAFNLLRGAEQLRVNADIDYVKRTKFGVWTRLLSTANVPSYIGIPTAQGGGAEYEAVKSRADMLDPQKTAEVLNDLKPREGQRRAVLADSRDATDYSDVLGNRRAIAVLREYQNLSLAIQVVEQGMLKNRLSSLIEAVDILVREVPRLDIPSEEDIARARELSAVTRTLYGAIRSRVEDADV